MKKRAKYEYLAAALQFKRCLPPCHGIPNCQHFERCLPSGHGVPDCQHDPSRGTSGTTNNESLISQSRWRFVLDLQIFFLYEIKGVRTFQESLCLAKQIWFVTGETFHMI